MAEVTGPRRWGLWLMSTWPRQIAVLVLCGIGFNLLLTEVLNGAEWVAIVSLCALGWTLGTAFPTPHEARERIAAKGDPNA